MARLAYRQQKYADALGLLRTAAKVPSHQQVAEELHVPAGGPHLLREPAEIPPGRGLL
ncbi:MAG: hypothetical protein WKG07_21275 [Hymenobacter sp.]